MIGEPVFCFCFVTVDKLGQALEGAGLYTGFPAAWYQVMNEWMVHEVLAKLFLEASCKFKSTMTLIPYSRVQCPLHSRMSGNKGHTRTHERDWGPVTIALQALSLVEKAEPVQVRYFTLRSRDQRSMWLQDGCEVYVDSYMASNGSCFMVTWIVYENRILEVGLTQNRETKALRTSQQLIDSLEFIEIAFGWGSVTTLHDFGGVLRWPLDTFFWALIISWSRLLAHVWSGPKSHITHETKGQWPSHSRIYHWTKRPKSSCTLERWRPIDSKILS